MSRPLPEFKDLPNGTFVICRMYGKHHFLKVADGGLLFDSIGAPSEDEVVYRCVITNDGAAVRAIASKTLIQSLKNELAADTNRLTGVSSIETSSDQAEQNVARQRISF